MHRSSFCRRRFLYLFFLIPFERPQTRCQLHCPYGFTIANFLQCVLIDSSAHEFPLWNSCDLRQLFNGGNCVSSSLVLDCFELQQTQVFAFFPMLVGFLSDVSWRPIRSDVCALQQTSRVELARLSVWPKALRFWAVLVTGQEHKEILDQCSATVVFVCQFVNGRLVIVNIDARRAHPLISLG
jgi:hypothetical protein